MTDMMSNVTYIRRIQIGCLTTILFNDQSAPELKTWRTWRQMTVVFFLLEDCLYIFLNLTFFFIILALLQSTFANSLFVLYNIVQYHIAYRPFLISFLISAS